MVFVWLARKAGLMNKMIFSFFCWAGLGLLVATLSGCDIGFADDMAKRQELSRINRGMPAATDLPPGIGEDLAEPPEPLTTNP